MQKMELQKMELVDIDDVYPYEQNDIRMNPRDVSSKECQRYIKQLAEQFKYNKLNPGQPRIRPILYRDGGIYQIIDGECRYMAMKQIGMKKFYADVFDDIGDAEIARQEAAKAMVETDAKRTLTSEEMSRGVQTMLSLEVSDDEVAAAANMATEAVKRTRRAMKTVGQDSAYMTLDRLMAIAEFDGTDAADSDAVEELKSCKDNEWRYVYENRMRIRKINLAKSFARNICLISGARELSSENLDHTVYVQRFFLDSLNEDDLRETLSKFPDAYFCFDGYWLEIRRDETDEDLANDAAEKQQQEEERREKDQEQELWEHERRNRESWIAEHVTDPKSMSTTAAVCADRALELAMPFIERTDCNVSFSPTPALILIGFTSSWEPTVPFVLEVLSKDIPPFRSYLLDDASNYIELSEAMEQDGYTPTEIGSKLLENLREWEGKNRD